jgi:hypothetical protein
MSMNAPKTRDVFGMQSDHAPNQTIKWEIGPAQRDFDAHAP